MRSVAVLVLLAACPGPRHGAAPIARDPHSQAEPDRVRVEHASIDLTVDFDRRELRGNVKLSLVRIEPGAPLSLDTDALVIEAVRACTTGAALRWRLAPRHSVLGQALVVTAPPACVEIAYRTTPGARALLWVDPAGTVGGRVPMLFTQSQAINARTWIPIQDSPAIRFTYDARIRVPAGMSAVMSAENPPLDTSPAADGAWHFEMKRSIPSYLLALAVGDLAFRPIGARTGVYAEPGLVDAAAEELAEVAKMLAIAERLCGPYRWERYDMIVLPPSFPFGGMENPRLTFLTPTVLAGDRSLVSLIAHELAHSWSGNLVTNATWGDFWLNEGITTYLERRIMAELRGLADDEASWYLGRKDLEEALRTAAPADTRLARTARADRDPDDVPGEPAYEKGALLMRALERAVGRDRLDAFLRARFDRLAFRSTDSASFEADVDAALGDRMSRDELARWLHDPGLPASAPPAVTPEIAAIERHARDFAATGAPLAPAPDWGTTEWVVFVRALPPTITHERVAALEAAHHLTAANAEIAMYWLPVLVRADAREAMPAIDAFLSKIGRRRMIQPLYDAMIARGGSWRALAREIFARVAPHYHPLVRDAIAPEL